MRLFFTLLFTIFALNSTNSQTKVLIFCETDGFVHDSIEAGIQALQQLGRQDNFQTVVSRDSRFFLENDLDQYDLIIFLNTTGDILNPEEQMQFQNYMDNGGNFFGIHSAADTEYDWKWYGDLVGAYFDGHPEVQQAEIIVEMPDHVTVEHLPRNWERTDEWYNYKNINKGLNVLLSLNEDSYEGGKNGNFHPIAWYQNYIAGGKAVYTGLGHTIESYSESNFLEHLSRCISFAVSG
ncbi:ThuA domain-containing protein [Gramella lutea]|uniref:ThuA domain-containing protein n=1 Tax=Christiangramia lutea TaxID=1607951 RepID=A0A9X1V2D6_9FLAO|nr:ThuA domain-containing protein [Christiangramia lutea]MCH4822560.1 ThuA domain-containing protein [Christiangramia lutea]